MRQFTSMGSLVIAVPALLMAGMAFFVWQKPLIQYGAPEVWFGLMGLGVLVVIAGRLPLRAWVWWTLGVLTLFWSQTPGNTLVVGLWEAVYLAAWVIGFWKPAYWGLNLTLLLYNLYTVLSLNAFNLQMYSSGSHHYMSGAQALLLVPALALAWATNTRWRWWAGVGLLLALYTALMSGSRAVYVALGFVVLLTLFRLWKEIGYKTLLVGTCGIVVSIVLIDLAVPFHPIERSLGGKVSLGRQAQDLSSENSIGSRLQMWDQTLQIGLKHPLGTGNGSFRDTLAAHLKYPGLVFANAHNYYLETFSTGGWLRLLALIALLWTLVAAWKSSQWAWAVGTAGLWVTLAFDITGMYPGMMLLAFAGLGAAAGVPRAKATRFFYPKIAWGMLALAAGLVVWWYWPGTTEQLIKRHWYQRDDISQIWTQLSASDQKALLEQALKPNPNSAWIYRTQLQQTIKPQERLELLRAINQKFPLHSPFYYLEQAKLAQSLGHTEEAVTALQKGLENFPAGHKSAKVPLASDDLYKTWTKEAPQMLKELKAK